MCYTNDPDREPLEARAVQCLAEVADALGLGEVPAPGWSAALEAVKRHMAPAAPDCPECGGCGYLPDGPVDTLPCHCGAPDPRTGEVAP